MQLAIVDSSRSQLERVLPWCRHVYLLLYRSRIVRRWISALGLVAIPFYVAAGPLAMYAVIGIASTEQTLMFMPMFVQELVVAVWMIARGFRPTTVSITPEGRERHTGRRESVANQGGLGLDSPIGREQSEMVEGISR